MKNFLVQLLTELTCFCVVTVICWSSGPRYHAQLPVLVSSELSVVYGYYSILFSCYETFGTSQM